MRNVILPEERRRLLGLLDGKRGYERRAKMDSKNRKYVLKLKK